MNDKFKQLALQAKMGTADFDAGSYYVATPDRMQKLCELIVRECARLADEETSLPYDSYGEKIKQNFGVEQ
jgi:hypothetical protein